MSKLEFLSPEGLRLDGRRPPELRRFVCSVGVFDQADGSAYVEMGSTKALASVRGPHEARSRARLHDKAVITCEYSMAPFSMGERKRRGPGDRRNAEAALFIRDTFSAAVQLHLFPRSQIDIFVHIIQADGGQLSAAINATTLALIDAGIPMQDYVTSCSAGLIQGTPVLDINQLERSANGPELVVGMLPRSRKVVMAQMERRLRVERFEEVMNLAADGCEALLQAMDKCVRENTAQQLSFTSVES